jgi:hypothetical protein
VSDTPSAGIIYTDGATADVTADEAKHLLHLGLIEPHPGAGEDGITENDYRLTYLAQWPEVYDVLGR